MRKLLMILLAGVTLFVMSGCTRLSNDDGDDDYHHHDYTSPGTQVATSDLSQGYTVTFYNDTDTDTTKYEGSTATTTDASGDIVAAQSGTFSADGDLITTQTPSGELNLVTEGDALTVGASVDIDGPEKAETMTVGAIDKI